MNKLTFFSEYGYVRVKREEYENSKNDFVHITNHRNDLLGTIKKINLSNTIKVNFKTLYGERILHTFGVNINEKLSVLIERLLSEEEKLKLDKLEKVEKSDKGDKIEKYEQKKRWQKNYQYRIISSIGSIKELDTHKSFIELGIKDGQTLVLADPEKIYFSEYHHGPGIILENKNSSAYKETGDEQQYAFINKGFSSGRWYFEFLLETEPDEQNIILGVSLARKDYYFTTDCKNFWGFDPSLCKTMFYQNGATEHVVYGDISTMGDKIGILMEFHEKGLDVSFFINKVDLGVAFKNLPNNTYYPCVLLYYDGAKVKVMNRVPIPDSLSH